MANHLMAGSRCWGCGCLYRSSFAGGGGGAGWVNTGSTPSAMLSVSCTAAYGVTMVNQDCKLAAYLDDPCMPL